MTENIGDYPLSNTKACKMLAEALARAEREEGMSQRSLAKTMNYKSSVVISHQALGRAPIPIDRSLDFARLLKINPSDFLLAVLEQRHPEIDFKRLLVPSKMGGASSVKKAAVSDFVVDDIESIAGMTMAELPTEKVTVIREVASEPQPRRRWLSVHELPIMNMLRKRFPEIISQGLDLASRKKIEESINS
jgi:hypothetical protein